jgi:hypothetical protein
LGFWVYVLGIRILGSEYRVQGSGYTVQGSGFRVQGSGFRVQGLCRVDLVGEARTVFVDTLGRYPSGRGTQGGPTL